jgi:nitrate/TMAO reductase-like tetraheme cytochrome c subunit
VTRDRAFLLRHPVAVAGIILTTVSAVVFIALAVAMFLGLLANPYAGLVVFIALPVLFVIGLLLVPFGMRLQRKALAEGRAGEDWPVLDFRRPHTRRMALIVAALTALNVVIVLVAGYGSLKWMESPAFCGAVCHEPMHPQYVAWQNAPHSNIHCVDCHIGEGGEAFVRYKLAGVRQLFHVVTNSYPRPIPGVADMRLAFDTCGRCHWPGRSIGDRVHVLRSYGDDEANTESATALTLHLGGPGTPGGRGIHWHANPDLRIEYVYTDEARQTIPWLRVTRPDGSSEEYVAEGVTRGQAPAGTPRRMDCIDCHNVVAHRIEPSVEHAVDSAITSGAVSTSLPFVRREAVKVMQAKYETTDAALSAIDQGLRGFYKAQSGLVDAAALERAVTALKEVYQRNVFPTMNVTFGTYPDNLGHTSSPGCFRCHDGSLTARDGSSITSDCESCHKMLEAEP